MDGFKDLGLTDAHGGCNCGTGVHAAGEAATVPENVVTADYLVSGMTCAHCVASVTEEISALDGVDGVSVDLNVGGASRVTVASARPLDTASVRAAVDEAGYELVDERS